MVGLSSAAMAFTDEDIYRRWDMGSRAIQCTFSWMQRHILGTSNRTRLLDHSSKPSCTRSTCWQQCCTWKSTAREEVCNRRVRLTGQGLGLQVRQVSWYSSVMTERCCCRDGSKWTEEETLEGHTDWVRDVAYAPNIGLPRTYLATASQVGSVCVEVEHSS